MHRESSGLPRENVSIRAAVWIAVVAFLGGTVTGAGGLILLIWWGLQDIDL